LTKNNFKNYILIAIIFAVLTLILTLPLLFIGIIVTSVLTALFGYITTKYHYSFVSFMSAFVFVIYLLFTKNFIHTLNSLIPIILCGVSFGIAYNLKLSEFKAISIFVFLYTLHLVMNISFFDAFNFENTLSYMTELYKNQFSETDINALISSFAEYVVRYMPSFIIIISISYSLLSFYLFKKILKRKKMDLSFFKNFSDWHADKTTSIFYVILGIVTLIYPGQSYFKDALLNVVVVSSFVFSIFGLSFISQIIKQKTFNSLLKKTIMFFIVIYALTTLGLPFSVLSILGVTDGIFDYRKKLKEPKLPE